MACQIAAILDVPTCYFYIDDNSFADQVLLLYKKDFCQSNEFENELITTLTEKTRKYEKAFELFKETMESIKSTHEGVQGTESKKD
ncbi:transcriptional regulator [Xenorhabdus mauleonii]|uniref:Transcriptional regulator n=1 Tax=Xenorhabdus mauleonii TaxID=351675 RepID=A0A2G0NTW3_9GAMM|nr:transcriptional regulator [Xenorhabdus mauleonii]